MFVEAQEPQKLNKQSDVNHTERAGAGWTLLAHAHEEAFCACARMWQALSLTLHSVCSPLLDYTAHRRTFMCGRVGGTVTLSRNV